MVKKEDLALYITMSIFFCNITKTNFLEVYENLNSISEEDFNPEEFAVWAPLVSHFDLDDLLEQVDNHRNFITNALVTYEDTNSK